MKQREIQNAAQSDEEIQIKHKRKSVNYTEGLSD